VIAALGRARAAVALAGRAVLDAGARRIAAEPELVVGDVAARERQGAEREHHRQAPDDDQ